MSRVRWVWLKHIAKGYKRTLNIIDNKKPIYIYVSESYFIPYHYIVIQSHTLESGISSSQNIFTARFGCNLPINGVV